MLTLHGLNFWVVVFISSRVTEWIRLGRLFVDSGVCSKLVSAIDKRFEAAGTRNACLVSSSGLHFIFVPKVSFTWTNII